MDFPSYISLDEISRLFGSFRKSAERLEFLQEFIVSGEEEAVEHFGTHGTLPLGFNADWYTLVRDARMRGARVARVKALSPTLSDYAKFELACFAENKRAGEEIRYCSQSRVKELMSGHFFKDFWIFDSETLVFIDYDHVGRFVGFQSHAVDVRFYQDIWMKLFSEAKDSENDVSGPHQRTQ
jgi:hypothetical protein